MVRVLAFLLSLSVSLLVTWAGLHYDRVLLYLGVTLLALTLILFLWSWAFPKPAPVTVQRIVVPPEPAPKDDKERALRALKRARDKGVAVRSEGDAHTVFNEIQAAMISINKQFGVPPLNFTEAPSYRSATNIYLHYIDEIYPRLAQGHVSSAKAIAAAFTWDS